MCRSIAIDLMKKEEEEEELIFPQACMAIERRPFNLKGYSKLRLKFCTHGNDTQWIVNEHTKKKYCVVYSSQTVNFVHWLRRKQDSFVEL